MTGTDAGAAGAADESGTAADNASGAPAEAATRTPPGPRARTGAGARPETADVPQADSDTGTGTGADSETGAGARAASGTGAGAVSADGPHASSGTGAGADSADGPHASSGTGAGADSTDGPHTASRTRPGARPGTRTGAASGARTTSAAKAVAPATRRRGRPSRAEAAGGPGARERILASARAEFAESGYDRASIRAIARGADVNPALVHHYFGTKEQVFAAAVASAAAPATQGLDAEARFAAQEFGESFTRLFFGIWENPEGRAPLLAILRSAMNNETAAAILRRFVAGELLARVAGGLDAPDAELRAELAAAQLVGVALLRYVLRVEPLAAIPAEELVRRLAPVVQHHLTGTD